MPWCIFCERPVPLEIREGCPRSVCLECLIQIRRFELQNAGTMMQQTLPKDVQEAIQRLRNVDASQPIDSAKQSQIQRDVDIAKRIMPS